MVIRRRDSGKVRHAADYRAVVAPHDLCASFAQRLSGAMEGSNNSNIKRQNKMWATFSDNTARSPHKSATGPKRALLSPRLHANLLHTGSVGHANYTGRNQTTRVRHDWRHSKPGWGRTEGGADSLPDVGSTHDSDVYDVLLHVRVHIVQVPLYLVHQVVDLRTGGGRRER